MNKLKGSSSAVKMKYLLFVFAAAVLVSLPTRVYQLLALVDTTNGFFKESDVTVPVLYGVVLVFGLLFMVLSFISKEVPSPKLPTGKNAILGIASFVMVAGLGADMLGILKKIIPANQGNAAIFVNLLKSNLSKNGGAFTILEFGFAFFAIIYFLVFAISHLNGKASYKEFKLLALAPLCWSMTVLVTKLMNAISFIKVSELLFEIFMFVFVMLFFLTFARVSSGVFTEDSMWGIYGYGLTAALLASIVTIPRIVMALVGLDAVEGNEFNFAHLAAFVFIVAYIFASLGIGFKDGFKNRRQVSDIDLPDEEVIVKKNSLNEYFEAEEEEIIEEVIAPLESFEESFETVEIAFEESAEETVVEIVEAAVEETEAETVVEIVEDTVEETEEIVEEIVEETVVEIVEAEVEETKEETVEEAVEEADDEIIELSVEESIDEIVLDAIEVEEPEDEIVFETVKIVFDEPEKEIVKDAIDFTFEDITEEVAEETAVEEAAEETVVEIVEVAVEEAAEETVVEIVEVAVEEAAEETVVEIVEAEVEETAEETVVEIVEAEVEEAIEFTLEEVAEESVKEVVKDAPKFGALEYTEARPEAKEKKKSKLFKKTGKIKKAPSRKDAGDSELTAISLADLKKQK